jgi:hypothetical protein
VRRRVGSRGRRVDGVGQASRPRPTGCRSVRRARETGQTRAPNPGTSRVVDRGCRGRRGRREPGHRGRGPWAMPRSGARRATGSLPWRGGAVVAGPRSLIETSIGGIARSGRSPRGPGGVGTTARQRM